MVTAPRFNLPLGQWVELDGRLLRFSGRARDRERRLLFEGLDGVPASMTDGELLDLQQREQRLRLLTAAEASDRLEEAGRPRVTLAASGADVGDEARRRLDYVRGWERAGCPPRTAAIAPVVKRVFRERQERGAKPVEARAPSARQVLRWIAEWVTSGADIESLVPQVANKGNVTDRLDPKAREIIERVVDDRYLVDTRPTVVSTYAHVVTAFDEHNRALPEAERVAVPSLRAAYRHVARLDRYTLDCCRLGPRAADHKWRPVGSAPATVRHNEVWEIDHTRVDAIVVHAGSGLPIGRPWVTSAIDRHTRAVPGLVIGFDPPGTGPVMDFLRVATFPKDALLAGCADVSGTWDCIGTPEVLVADRGREFRSRAFVEACLLLGIDVQYAPVLKAWYKGKIERFFRTLAMDVFHRVPGTTFSSFFLRNKEAVPETVAVVTLDELRAHAVRWVVEVCNRRRHRGLGVSPAEAYAESVRRNGTRPLPDPERAAAALSRIAYRIPQRYGIEFEGLLYNSPDVAALRVRPDGRKAVRVAVDPRDLSGIRFLDPETNAFVEVPIQEAQRERVRGVTLEKHRLARALQNANPETLAGEEGIRRAYTLIDDAMRERGAKGGLANRAKAARHWEQIMKARPPEEPPAFDTAASAASVTDGLFDDGPDGADAPGAPGAGAAPGPVSAESPTAEPARPAPVEAAPGGAARRGPGRPPQAEGRGGGRRRPVRGGGGRGRRRRRRSPGGVREPDGPGREQDGGRPMSGMRGVRAEALSNLFIDTTRSNAVMPRIDELLLRGWERQFCRALLLLGPSRSGKSHIVEEWVRRRTAAAAAAGGAFRVAVAEVPPGCTLKTMAAELLKVLGDPDPDHGTQTERTTRVAELVERRALDLLVIDEIQRLVDTDTEKVKREVANWLTALLNRRLCPLLLVGEPHAARVFEGSMYLQGRTLGEADVVAYDWADPSDRAEFRVFLNFLDRELGMPERSGLGDVETALRVHSFSDGLVGQAARLVDEARSLARSAGRPRVARDDLARAVDQLRIGDAKRLPNPFRVEVPKPGGAAPAHVRDPEEAPPPRAGPSRQGARVMDATEARMAVAPGALPGGGYALPGALRPEPDESLPGLVMRNAALYRFHDPMRIFRRLRPPKVLLWTFCLQDPSSPMGRATGALLGLEEATFRRLSMWTGSDTAIAVLGQPVWAELVRHSVRAVCVPCLRESARHRAAWMVDALPVCPVHGAWLRDRCPNPRCRGFLAWNGHGVHLCSSERCRRDLRDSPVETADPEGIAGIAALHRALHAGDASASPLGMPPGEAVRMAFVLGQIAFGHERATRPPGFIRRELRRMPAIMDAGWRALDDWPHGFHALLDRLRGRAAARAGKDGLRKAFGVTSKLVYDWAREPWGGPVGVAFAEYAAAQPDLATTSHVLRRYAPGAELRHRHVSLGEAQRLVGVGPVTMMAIAERRDMYVLPPRGAGTPALLRADAVRDLAEELADFLLPEQARALLGVGRKVMDQLEAADLVRRVPEGERLMNSRCFRRGEVEAFVASCVGKARRATRAAAREEGLTALTRAVAPGRSVVDLCRALAAGRLRSVATVAEARGLMRLRLRMADVEEALPSGRETMSMVDAARTLGNGANYGCLHVWARRGLLETVRSPRRGERGLRVERAALERFRRTYLTGGELAALFGQEGNFWLSRHLRHQGVVPVSGPGVDECRVSLFRRADCTPEVMEAVRRVQDGRPGTPQDKHRAAFAKAAAVASAVAARWGARFARTANRFVDENRGRTLQVVSGRRPDMTGPFRFQLKRTSLEALRASPDPWVALVPDDGRTFLLVPCERLRWRGETLAAAYVQVRFDGRGRPLEMAEWAMTLPGDGEGDAA